MLFTLSLVPHLLRLCASRVYILLLLFFYHHSAVHTAYFISNGLLPKPVVFIITVVHIAPLPSPAVCFLRQPKLFIILLILFHCCVVLCCCVACWITFVCFFRFCYVILVSSVSFSQQLFRLQRKYSCHFKQNINYLNKETTTTKKFHKQKNDEYG